MKWLKQLRFVIGGITACAVIFLIEIIGGGVFGKLINQFFPCIQPASNPAYSSDIPCYAVYDLGLLYILEFIVFVLMLLVCIRTIKYFMHKR